MQKIINFDDVIKKNIKKYNSNWEQVPDQRYRILIRKGFESGQTSSYLI